MARRVARRKWRLEANGIRRLGTKQTGFTYVHADGREVTDERTLARIRALRIPPAWADVRIARGDAADLQAVGLDSKGRVQYRYHARFRERRELEKYIHLASFGEALPRLRGRVSTDLRRAGLDRDCVVAAIIRLIDQGFFRVGNDRSAKSESTYGLTTVRTEHVVVRGDAIDIDYIGKWKKRHARELEDADVAKVVRRLKRLGGDPELFKYVQNGRVYDVKDRHVNDYIQAVTAQEFTAKDFRTWAGTLFAHIELAAAKQEHAESEKRPSQREMKRKVKAALEQTASRLGNTPAVARKSYVCPALLEAYLEEKDYVSARAKRKARPVARAGLSFEEKALLRFLREAIADRRSRDRRIVSLDAPSRERRIADRRANSRTADLHELKLASGS
jgi:DNA topoisomerase I